MANKLKREQRTSLRHFRTLTRPRRERPDTVASLPVTSDFAHPDIGIESEATDALDPHSGTSRAQTVPSKKCVRRRMISSDDQAGGPTLSNKRTGAATSFSLGHGFRAPRRPAGVTARRVLVHPTRQHLPSARELDACRSATTVLSVPRRSRVIIVRRAQIGSSRFRERSVAHDEVLRPRKLSTLPRRDPILRPPRRV